MRLLFFHYFKFTKEFLENWAESQPAEWKRYNDLLAKHGLTLVRHGVPYGSEYDWVGVIESENGLEPWEAFNQEYIAYGSSLGWARADVKTDVIRAQG